MRCAACRKCTLWGSPFPRHFERTLSHTPTPPTSFLLPLPCSTFKKRAARAVSEVKKFATQVMSTKEVKIDADLNKFVWHKGIRNVPTRVRVKLERRRNEDEDAKEKMLTYVSHVPLKAARDQNGPSEFKNLSTKRDEE